MSGSGVHEMLNGVIQAVGLDLSGFTLLAVWLASFALAKKLLGGSRKADRGRRIWAWLAGKLHSRLRNLYGDGITLLLSWLDRGAGDDFLEKAARLQSRIAFRNPSPWSYGLYDLTLKLALAYPLLFFVVGWMLWGGTVTGLDTFLPPEPEVLARAVNFAGFVVFLVCFVQFLRSSGWRSVIYLLFTVAVAVAVAELYDVLSTITINAFVFGLL